MAGARVLRRCVVPLSRLASCLLALGLLLLAGCGATDAGGDLGQRLAASGHPVAPAVPGPLPPAARAILPDPRSAPAPAAAPAPGMPAPSASPLITADQLFDWAERTLPQFFPARAPSWDLPPYRFRYYADTQLYLAVEGGERVLLLGAPTGWQVLPVGNLADFAPLVNAPPPTPTVSDIQPDRLLYLQTTAFRVTGTALDAGLTVVARGCAEAAPVPAITATEVLVGCSVTAAGTDAVGLEVRSAAGAVLASRSFTVPRPQVTISTTLGTIVVELEPTAAPLSTNNFLRYVQAGFYDNTIFHRVVRNFVVQGGWLTPTLGVKAGARPPIPLETNRGLSNLRGTIAMARTSAPDTATSQFFVNLIDNPALDYAGPTSPGYAVFGRVVQGLPVVDAIGAVSTGTLVGLFPFDLVGFPISNVIVQSAVQTR